MRKTVRQRSFRLRHAGSTLAFWTLAIAGTGLFAIGVLATPWCERQDARHRLAAEQARARQVAQLAENLRVVCNALADDPRYLARQIRQDLGYHRPDEEPLPSSGRHLCPPLASAVPEAPPDPAIAPLCRTFSRPVIKQVTVAVGVMLLGIALLWFEATPASGNTDDRAAR